MASKEIKGGAQPKKQRMCERRIKDSIDQFPKEGYSYDKEQTYGSGGIRIGFDAGSGINAHCERNKGCQSLRYRLRKSKLIATRQLFYPSTKEDWLPAI